MRIVADLHIHSHYSRATSKNLTLPHLWKWAQLKGVTLVGTGDLSHPGWLAEMREHLEPAEPGLFRLKESTAAEIRHEVPPACRRDVRFMLTGEISNIYKRHGKVRKVHNVVFAPSLELVETIQARLETIGNIRADGRPILGLDSRDLLEIMLETDPRCHFIPAHIWTPWFSMLGSKSGFDTVEECFGDLTGYIFAVETGLSSDPAMNRRVSMLDGYSLVSHSDAHSPQKLAREATLFETDLSYDALFAALQGGDPDQCLGTIEFFPEEGKYHHDGHRKCKINWPPRTTLAHDGICPVCNRPVTVGVSHRVEVLADRAEHAVATETPYYSLIPLPEIVSELIGVGVNSKKVQREYLRLLGELGPELDILLTLDGDAIEATGGAPLAQGIAAMRRGEVTRIAGYDGEYGVIKLFAVPETPVGPSATESGSNAPQLQLFSRHATGVSPSVESEDRQPADVPDRNMAVTRPDPPALPAHDRTHKPKHQAASSGPIDRGATPWNQPALLWQSNGDTVGTPLGAMLTDLNADQRTAVTWLSTPLVIVAGPGTGKTRTLTYRIAHLIGDHGVNPASVLAITFTNKAAAEVRSRLVALLGGDLADQITAGTFHAFGARILAEYGERIDVPANFTIGGPRETLRVLRRLYPEMPVSDLETLQYRISQAKIRLQQPTDIPDDELIGGRSVAAMYHRYARALQTAGMIDFDDLIMQTVHLFERVPAALQTVQTRYRWLSVDEYQDVNYAQYRLLQLLTVGGANLCVIGDPDQAIYGFRGADRRYFLTFTDDYPDAHVLRLSRNYRSIRTILDAAQQVIDKSPDRDAYRIWATTEDDSRIAVHTSPTGAAEAEFVVHQIEQMVGGTSYFSLDSDRVDDRRTGSHGDYTFGDFAVLYRTGAQAHLLIEAFERSGIPYQCATGKRPAEFADIGRVLALLHLRYNCASAVHWDLLLNDTDGTNRAADRIGPQLLTDFLADVVDGVQPAEAMRRRRGLIRGSDLAHVDTVLEQVTRLMDLPEQTAVTAQIAAVAVAAAAPPAGGTLIPCDPERFAQFVRRARLCDERLGDFLNGYQLEHEGDFYDARADRVGLMTLHAAKGLEFPVVFMVGCEEGLLPYGRPDQSAAEEDPAQIAEERRLFYVGMTRAEQRLFLTRAQRRLVYGRRVEHPVSRFVVDVENSLLDESRSRIRRSGRSGRSTDDEHVQLTLDL